MPLPLRPEAFEDMKDVSGVIIPTRRSNIHRLPMTRPSHSCSQELLICRNEGRHFKNISIHFTELAKTPAVSNVRNQQHKDTSKRKVKVMGPFRERKRRKVQAEHCKASNIINNFGMDMFSPGLRTDFPQGIELFTEASVPSKSEMITDMDPLVAWILGLEVPKVDSIQYTRTAEKSFGRLKCPSVISEPVWLAFSSTTSDMGLQSAPSEYFPLTGATHRDPRDSSRPRLGQAQPIKREKRKPLKEILRLRACLRCKFLKKTCDKGEPCQGCLPSHERLWKVPCTRIDIKNLDYFLEDWDWIYYENRFGHGTNYFNVRNTCQEETLIWITHGYGFSLPVMARSSSMVDNTLLEPEWDGFHRVDQEPVEFEADTARLEFGQEGVPMDRLAEYIDKHISVSFENIVDSLFEGIPFVTDILKTVHRYYAKEKGPTICKALKLVLSFKLTSRITMVENQDLECPLEGQSNEVKSEYHKMVVVPLMVDLEIKRALTHMWHTLHSEILEELSTLYSGVYSGARLKNWFLIFALSVTLLIVWAEIQFDYHYRVFDSFAVNKFCTSMEAVPVAVIVGLFRAISQKLPSFIEWDTRRHGHLLNNNVAICEALTEMREHITKHGRQYSPYQMIWYQLPLLMSPTETYLQAQQDATFCRRTRDSLSCKFLSTLVSKPQAPAVANNELNRG